MSEEIPVFSWDTKTKEFSVLGHKFYGINSIEEFIEYLQNQDKKIERLQKENEILRHRLEVANEYIDDRKENMIIDHVIDLKYIINECDLDSTW